MSKEPSKLESILKLAVSFIGQFENVATDISTRKTYVSAGISYLHISDLEMQHFAEMNCQFPLSRSLASEFVERVKRHNPVGADFFNAPEGKLCFKNGVLDLKTRTLSRHSIEYGFTRVLDYEYAAKTRSPRFDLYLQEATAGNPGCDSTFLEFGGYCLWGGPPWAQVALYAYGPKNTGKSTGLDILSSLITPYVRRIEMASLLKGRFDAEQLFGNLVNISEEVPSDTLLRSDSFKNLITASTLDVEPKGRPRYVIENRCKHILSANHLPQIGDSSGGTTRRLLIAPFENEVPPDKRDPRLVARLLEERSGILNSMLDAYSEAWARKSFSVSRRAVELFNQVERGACPISFWLRTRCEVLPVGSGVFSPTDRLYADYERFETADDRKPKSKDDFAKRLKSLQEKRYAMGGPTEARQRGYQDLKLKDL